MVRYMHGTRMVHAWSRSCLREDGGEVVPQVEQHLHAGVQRVLQLRRVGAWAAARAHAAQQGAQLLEQGWGWVEVSLSRLATSGAPPPWARTSRSLTTRGCTMACIAGSTCAGASWLTT
eukprot:scaffold65892_cov35-Phaeocystis_antarctica.AAC.2